MDKDIDNWPPQLKFIYLAMTKSAIFFKEMDRDKQFFLNFAEEIWNSMDLSDLDYLKEIISGKMRKDLEPYVKRFLENERKQ